MSLTNVGVRVEFVCDDEKLHEYVLIHRVTGYNGVEPSLVIRRGSAGPLSEGFPLCLLPPPHIPALLSHPPDSPLGILPACLHPGAPRGHSSRRFTTTSNQTGFWRLHSTRSSNWERWCTSCPSATASLWHCTLALHPLWRSWRTGGGRGVGVRVQPRLGGGSC